MRFARATPRHRCPSPNVVSHSTPNGTARADRAMSRRSLLTGGAAVAAAFGLGQLVGDPLGTAQMMRAKPPITSGGAVYYPYSTDSFYQSSTAGLAVNSTLTAQMRTFLSSQHVQSDWPYPCLHGLDGDQWGMPYAEPQADDPLWSLTGKIPPAIAQLAKQGFHAPTWFGDQLTGTSDSPFVVCDTVSGVSVWACGASVVGQYAISVRDCGIFEHASNGLDKRNPYSDSTVNFRTRGCIPDSMVIRSSATNAAIAQGTGLGYVLHMMFCETLTAAGFVSPLIACEKGKYGWGAEGTRIGIDRSIDLSQRGMSPAGLAVARTLQDHGCILGDNSGGPCALKAEQSTQVYDPWQGLDINHRSLQGVTWADFVVYG